MGLGLLKMHIISWVSFDIGKLNDYPWLANHKLLAQVWHLYAPALHVVPYVGEGLSLNSKI